MERDVQALAKKFIDQTDAPIFLTGKAGTGKTTFLESLPDFTDKSYIIVAPTGVAALNAQGVTIHSQFLFPFGTFCVDQQHQPQFSASFYNAQDLIRKHPLNAVRTKVLRGIDLLVIDEVSMVRADMMDAIDHRLRRVRRNQRPFGGVQLLLIGDLLQLAPVVKPEEAAYLNAVYPSVYFFSAKALQEVPPIFLELNKVFRQEDPIFVDLLNALRHQHLNETQRAVLDQRISANPPSDTIHLVTHRQQAQAENQTRLDALEGELHFYPAKIQGDFPERLFPLSEELALKIGARVMFIRNDGEGKRFYNGKIVEVLSLGEEEIIVDLDGEDFSVPKHKWENISYVAGKDGEPEEKVLGSFEQYPLRLAWAITVHKSQGLTFEKAHLDLGRAFAPGQVYVALSRLRSLEGLTLAQGISSSHFSTEKVLEDYLAQSQTSDPERQFEEKHQQYLQRLIQETLNPKPLAAAIRRYLQENDHRFEEPVKPWVDQVLNDLLEWEKPQAAFARQLTEILASQDRNHLLERMEKGKSYLLKLLRRVAANLVLLACEVEALKRNKALMADLELLLNQVLLTYHHHWVLPLKFQALNQERSKQDFSLGRTELSEHLAQVRQRYLLEHQERLEEKKQKRKKTPKGETYRTSYEMLEKGMSFEEVAEARNLRPSTIKSHAKKGLKEGVLDWALFLNQTKREHLERFYNPDLGIRDHSEKFPQFSLDDWSLAIAYLSRSKNAS